MVIHGFSLKFNLSHEVILSSILGHIWLQEEREVL